MRSNAFLKSNRTSLTKAPLPRLATLWTMLIRACVVDDFGTVPYWSTTLRIAGLINCSTTTSSASFETIGANETGLKSLFTVRTGFCFGMGITSANFQAVGKRFSR